MRSRSDRETGWFLAHVVARSELVHEPLPGLVVAGVGSEEGSVAAGQFLLAV